MWPAVPMTTDAHRASPASRRAAPACPGALLALARLQVALRLRLRLAPARAAVVLRRAHALEDLGQAEIDLPPLHVDLDHLHAHAVAEAVDAAGVLAAQHVLLAR